MIHALQARFASNASGVRRAFRVPAHVVLTATRGGAAIEAEAQAPLTRDELAGMLTRLEHFERRRAFFGED